MSRSTLRIATLAPLVLALGLAPAQAQDPPIPDDTEIQTTASGLKYSALTEVEGEDRPGPEDTVRVHYTGWLTDGTLFDSSRQRGKPAEFAVGGVIAGWTEALQLMSPGDRYKLTIPWKLAYGESGRPPKIPPKADLVFDVELLEILRPPKFEPIDLEEAQRTESGLAYVVEKEGTGEAVTPDDFVRFHLTFWSPEGRLLQTTTSQDAPMSTKVSALQHEFMREMLVGTKAGERRRWHVPPEQSSALSPELATGSIWLIETAGIVATPAYTPPDEAALRSTDSGLKYQVLEEGEGTPPKQYEYVSVRYNGWLTDGTFFDGTSIRGDQPFEFLVGGRVIPGWNEGIQLMKPGAKYRFVIPPELAYGAQGSPPAIPPNATLVFEIELLKVGK